MVKITNFFNVETKDGKNFISLELTGSIELVQSQSTGKFYATIRKCRIPSTFSEEIAKTMLGQELEGEIVRVQVDAYQFANKQTGEIMTLQHSYAYRPKGSMELVGHSQVHEIQMA